MEKDLREEALNLGIGKKIKDLRRKRGLTLSQVSSMSGLSVGLLSQIENDGVVPPIPTLLSISKALGIKIETFFKEDEEKSKVSVVKKAEQEPDPYRRPADVGYHYKALAHRRVEKKMEPFLVEFEPRPREAMRFFSHEGEEFIYVLEGILEFVTEGESHILEAGDSIYFDSSGPHAVRGIDTRQSKAIIVVTS